MAPVLCPAVSSKVSLLGLGWSITTVLSALAFISAAIATALIHSQYNKVAEMQNREDWERDGEEHENGEGRWLLHRYLEDNQDGGKDSSEDNNSDDNEIDYDLLASVNSTAVTFSFLYTAILALLLTIYGSTYVVGFTTIGGKYVEPCFSSEESDGVDEVAVVGIVDTELIDGRSRRKEKLKIGVFMGLLVLFANLCLVTAVILGEVKVVKKNDIDDMNEGGQDNNESVSTFAIEKIAAVIGVMSMFLSIIYLSYSFLLFSFRNVLTLPKSHHGLTSKQGVTRQRHYHHSVGVAVGDSIIYSPPSLSNAKFS